MVLTVERDHVRGQWDIALRDLDDAIGLDANDNGAITWDEVRLREADVAAYAFARLRLTSRGQPCSLGPSRLLVDHHSDGAYAVLQFSDACSEDISVLQVEYRLFFDLNPQHRGLAKITASGITHTAIFSPEQSVQQFDLGYASSARQFLAFVGEGISHIWIGIDHLLFLFALLLPSVVVRTQAGYEPVTRLPDALWSVIKIATSFTVAHSITLSLTACNLVAAPSRWVETAIAASVLLAALNNLYPVVRGRLWLVAFLFGLIHGFGFAGTLLDLGLPRHALVLSLFGFNLGVEIGQLVFVAIFFALAYPLRSARLYYRAALTGGSAVIALIALIWMLERGFNLKLLPF
ncbi:MAG: HupE/UreJ family protein [Chthoniobacterales bacterium]